MLPGSVSDCCVVGAMLHRSVSDSCVVLCCRVLQLVITVLIQYFLMRDLEKLTGSLRIGIIYMGSGVAGNLASAIFVPYRADVSTT